MIIRQLIGESTQIKGVTAETLHSVKHSIIGDSEPEIVLRMNSFELSEWSLGILSPEQATNLRSWLIYDCGFTLSNSVQLDEETLEFIRLFKLQERVSRLWQLFLQSGNVISGENPITGNFSDLRVYNNATIGLGEHYSTDYLYIPNLVVLNSLHFRSNAYLKRECTIHVLSSCSITTDHAGAFNESQIKYVPREQILKNFDFLT